MAADKYYVSTFISYYKDYSIPQELYPFGCPYSSQYYTCEQLGRGSSVSSSPAVGGYSEEEGVGIDWRCPPLEGGRGVSDTQSMVHYRPTPAPPGTDFIRRVLTPLPLPYSISTPKKKSPIEES